jgi:hypothetical protein
MPDPVLLGDGREAVCQPEICDEQIPIRCEEQVTGLDIPVDDAVLVEGV